MKLLLATRSAHKAREVARIVGDGWEGDSWLATLDDVAIPYSPVEESLEPFDTFEENAASKARYFARLSGLPTVADDSGIEVDALGGRPGVRTKRFAPPGRYPDLSRDDANNRYLLERLEHVAARDRGARYVCVASFIDPASGETAHFRGEAPGRILREGRGTGGFGYDPIFQDDGLQRTFAEISEVEKNARSHRGKAFRAFAEFLAGRS